MDFQKGRANICRTLILYLELSFNDSHYYFVSPLKNRARLEKNTFSKEKIPYSELFEKQIFLILIRAFEICISFRSILFAINL